MYRANVRNTLDTDFYNRDTNILILYHKCDCENYRFQ